jgi:hypothetical protein
MVRQHVPVVSFAFLNTAHAQTETALHVYICVYINKKTVAAKDSGDAEQTVTKTNAYKICPFRFP